MSRPVFGDKETIEQLDPYRKFLECGTTVPREVCLCPFCDSQLAVTFDDIWVSGDELGAGTIEVSCIQDGDWVPFWLACDHFSEEFYWVGMGYDKLVGKIVRWIQTKYPTFKHDC